MLEAREISLRLGTKGVLHEITLQVRRREIVALIGPNGAGKSSLLACLSGALTPQSGEVLIDGDLPGNLPPAEMGLRRAVLEQTPSASAAFTTLELIGLAIPVAIPPADARRLAARAALALGLTALLDHPISWLSGGERHRAHMARTLAQLWAGRQLGAGDWLMLDEPTASLDLAHQLAVLDAARGAARDGAGVLVVLHDLTLAGSLADRAILMQDGRIAAEGPVPDVLTPAVLAPVYRTGVEVIETPSGARAVVPIFHTITEEISHVHSDEPLPGRQRAGNRVRGGLAQPADPPG
ncbi:MAG: ATP-binding cassette domain-containing protein [Pseudomonadota bacterium]